MKATERERVIGLSAPSNKNGFKNSIIQFDLNRRDSCNSLEVESHGHLILKW